MGLFRDKTFKYKMLTVDELVINLDRLSRFKLPEYSYFRVFSSIIQKNLIFPKYNKSELENLSPEINSYIVKEIWNKSVQNIWGKSNSFDSAYKAQKMLINQTYKNIDEKTSVFVKTVLRFSEILNSLSNNELPKNLKFLKKVSDTYKDSNFSFKDLIQLRDEHALEFPISRLIIVEGITEEILLPVFANKLGVNFDEKGIFILGAGGKSKSPALYFELKDKIKIPISILFDDDAKDIVDVLNTNLLKKDKSVLIQKGEFEDILSVNLIKRSLNAEYEIAVPITKSELLLYPRMCQNLEEFYRTRHLGEFKKAKLSKILAENIKYDTDVTEDIKCLIKSLL